jgi:bifunctional non-homologous end joining protein LigD
MAKKSNDGKTAAAEAASIKSGKTIVSLTNQQKIYFPGEGITKGDIIKYYDSIATYILPYLKNRPQSLNRFPNGIDQQSFYQKDQDLTKIPSWLTTAPVYSESNAEIINYLICNDKATLLYMANLGCIEINPWNSRITKPENPDWMVIDLDPEKIAFTSVVKVALEVKNVFDEIDVECYCKTSGATGLHIYIPLAARYNYDIVKTFAELIAHTVWVRIPEITSIERSPSKRQGKVYLDFLQNRRGQTLAAPYSARPKKGATVSTPLEWKEVNKNLDPSQFTIKNTLKRIEQKGDLWSPVIGKGANLNSIMKKMEGR